MTDKQEIDKIKKLTRLVDAKPIIEGLRKMPLTEHEAELMRQATIRGAERAAKLLIQRGVLENRFTVDEMDRMMKDNHLLLRDLDAILGSYFCNIDKPDKDGITIVTNTGSNIHNAQAFILHRFNINVITLDELPKLIEDNPIA